MDTFYSQTELAELGIARFGENVRISRKTSIYEPGKLRIGNNVRIDDFCILSGEIRLASNIHIAAYCALYGMYGISMEEYTGLSPRCTLLSGNDDFSGDSMISPMAPKDYTNVTGAPIRIKRFGQVGAGSIILPGVTISEGAVVGALSFVKRDIPEWSIFAGNPARFIKDRRKGLLEKYAKIVRCEGPGTTDGEGMGA